jgi:hypothetical protein
MPTTDTKALSYDDVVISVRALRGRPITVMIMTANDQPQPIATLAGRVDRQQTDEDWPGVVHTHVRAAGTFALDYDRFVAARWGAGTLMVRQGETMIAITTD